jgi:UPF0716 protein FxsA
VPLLLLIAFVVVPIAELYIIIQIGQEIGALWTIVLLLLDAVLGTWLVRREGARTWRAFTRAVNDGRVPAKEVADGALVIFGAALLLTPGFLTDVVGLLCLLPPSRAAIRRLVLRFVTRRFVAVPVQGAGHGPIRVMRVRSRRGPSRPDVIDGEIEHPTPE